MNTATQNGTTLYDNLLSTIEENDQHLKRLNKEIDRMIADKLKDAEKYNAIRLQLSTSNMHLFKFLDEMEGRFDADGDFDSPEICKDYIEAATYCKKYFGRDHNRIYLAEQWYNEQPVR